MSLTKPTSAEVKAAKLILKAAESASKKSSTKSKTNKKAKLKGLPAFKEWAKKKEFSITDVKPMTYERKDGSSHKGHVAKMGNGSTILVFEHMFKGASKCTNLNWKED